MVQVCEMPQIHSCKRVHERQSRSTWNAVFDILISLSIVPVSWLVECAMPSAQKEFRMCLNSGPKLEVLAFISERKKPPVSGYHSTPVDIPFGGRVRKKSAVCKYASVGGHR